MATSAAIPHIFVSHNHQDVAFCRADVQVLRAYGYEVWYDEHNLGAVRSGHFQVPRLPNPFIPMMPDGVDRS